MLLPLPPARRCVPPPSVAGATSTALPTFTIWLSDPIMGTVAAAKGASDEVAMTEALLMVLLLFKRASNIDAVEGPPAAPRSLFDPPPARFIGDDDRAFT